MRAGKAKAAEREWCRVQPMYDPDWRKPQRRSWWKRMMAWLNSP